MKEHKQEPNKENLLKQTINYCLGKGFLTAATQPIQVAINQQQKNPQLTIRSAFGKTFHEVGPLKGLFPSTLRELGKGVYKAPLMIKAQGISNHLLDNTLPSSLQSKLLENVLAGAGVGIIDAWLSIPIERYKTYRTTSEVGTESFATYIKNSESPLVMSQKLLKGVNIYALKQSLMMSSFFVFNDVGNNLASKIFDPEEQNKRKMFASTLAALSVCIVSAPLDVIKTQRQMNGSTNLSTAQLFKQNLKAHGLIGLAAGTQLKFALTFT